MVEKISTDRLVSKRSTSGLFVKLLGLVAVIFCVGALVSAVYFYREYQRVKAQVPQSKEDQEKELKFVLPPLKKLIDLPDETPNIATIIDKEKLKNQPFFTKAENGDKLVIFESSKKAILFRPSANKIINFDVFVVNPNANAQSQSASQPQNPTPQAQTTVAIAVYNGTGEPGLASSLEKKLKDAVPNLKIVKGDAKAKYDKTLIIDVSKKIANGAQDVAKFVGGEIAELPQGEAKPDADILIIIGKTQ